jgi:hypothetical protein
MGLRPIPRGEQRMTRWHGHHQRVAPYGARARMPSPTSIQLGKAHVVEIATQPFDCEGRLKQADLRFRFLGTRELGRCSKGLPLRYRITGYALVGTEGLRAPFPSMGGSRLEAGIRERRLTGIEYGISSRSSCSITIQQIRRDPTNVVHRTDAIFRKENPILMRV